MSVGAAISSGAHTEAAFGETFSVLSAIDNDISASLLSKRKRHCWCRAGKQSKTQSSRLGTENMASGCVFVSLAQKSKLNNEAGPQTTPF